MPHIKFIGNWKRQYQEQFSIPKGYLIIKYDNFYREKLGKTLLKLDSFQNKKYQEAIQKAKENGTGEIQMSDCLRDLEINITYHYRKRTLDQNALMWSLYSIEANEQNGGQSGHKEQMITSEDLYFSDLEEYGDVEIIITKRSNLSYYISEYQIIKSVKTNEINEEPLDSFIKRQIHDNELITLKVIRGSSKFNTVEMAEWIERLFNRLAYNGVLLKDSSAISKYWHDWKNHLNENKIILNDIIMTIDEYKAYNPICEACGEFIIGGHGELAHIKSIGMGGDRSKEPKKNYTSNWLHLHANPCHRVDWHEKGYKNFLKKYRHLSYKVLTALKRDYEPIEDVDILEQETHCFKCKKEIQECKCIELDIF